MQYQNQASLLEGFSPSPRGGKLEGGSVPTMPHDRAYLDADRKIEEARPHTLLKAKDPSFGGLVRVMNKRQGFLWVHEKFAGEY